MKKWNYIWTDMLVGLLMGAASIIIADLLASCSSHPEDGSQEIAPALAPTADLPIQLRITCADFQPASQASRADGSVKGIEGIPNGSIQILCFDSNGGFIGMADEVSNTQSTADGEHLQEDKSQTLRALIPAATTQLHILANAHIQAKEAWLGKTQEEVMEQLESNHDTHEHLVYWGYIHTASTAEMKAYLENSSTTVSLLRDRAKISYANQDADIQDVKIALCNGLASGKMTGVLSATDASTEGNSILHLPADPSLRIDNTEADFASTAFTFEHSNRPGDYLRAIVRVKYKDGPIRYHHICLENDLHEPYAILRNHEYRINLIRLSESTGYGSFEEARNGDASNNAFITVDDIVPEISDGTHSLLINAGTSVVYNAGAATEQVIHFTYMGDAKMEAASFKATWIDNQHLAADAAPTLTYDGQTGQGEIRFQLQPLSPELKTAQLHLLDTQHGLSRVIHLYSITQFEMQLAFPATLGKAKGDIENLTVELPANYPEDLLPIELKIASNDINPKDLAVEVSPTDDVDGSEADASIKPWNCWFVYKAIQPGTHTIGIKNVRDAKAGSQGKFYVKAEYFGSAKEINFVYQ